MKQEVIPFYDGKENKYYLYIHCYGNLFHVQNKIEISEADYLCTRLMLSNTKQMEMLDNIVKGMEKELEKSKRR